MVLSSGRDKQHICKRVHLDSSVYLPDFWAAEYLTIPLPSGRNRLFTS